jgi:hypothetical protein
MRCRLIVRLAGIQWSGRCAVMALAVICMKIPKYLTMAAVGQARIRNGMVICIEPMINMGSRNIVIEQDGWTCRTRDRKPSAHYEHTVAVIGGKTDILTTFDYIKDVLKDKFI